MKKLKKAFTLTELVIVIAVIAILAAVLIPTYTSLVRKANISSDTQLAVQMNTIIASADVENMEDVLQALDNAGFGVGKINPTTENYRFVWDETSNQILLLDENFTVVSSAKDYNETNWELWLTIKNQAEITSSINTNINFNYFLANDYNGNLTLPKLSSFSTGTSELTGNVLLDTAGNGTAAFDATINGTLTLDTPNASISIYGAVQNVVLNAVNNSSLNIYGYIQTLTVSEGNVITQPASYVKTLTFATNSTSIVTNNSIIGSITGAVTTANLINTTGYVEIVDEDTQAEIITNPDNYTVQIGTYSQLVAFRDAVNNGATYEGILVQLTSNIALQNGWTPIGEFARKSRGATVTTTLPEGQLIGFAGIFDGNDKTISNLNNIGYSVKSTALFENDSTVEGKQEYAYGLFGVVSGAEIKDLTLSNVNINIPNGTTTYGDSVGAIVGYSCGDLTLNNCRAVGFVSAYDGVGGLVGRAYLTEKSNAGVSVIFGTTIQFIDCTSEIQVIGNEKSGGIIGYVGGATVTSAITFNGCINKGSVDASSTFATANNVAYAGGMTSLAAKGVYLFINCENQGNVTATYSFSTNVYAHELICLFDTKDCSQTSCRNTGIITIAQ